MKKILSFLLLLVSINALAQNTTYSVSKDPQNGELSFNGPLTFDDLNKETTFTWLKEGREGYRPNQGIISFLKEKLSGPQYSMVVFMGTWCSDSHELIPKLEALLKLIDFSTQRLTMYGTDRDKKTKNGEEKQYNVTLVPTIIIFEGTKEVGRITETVQKSLEEDLVAMFHN